MKKKNSSYQLAITTEGDIHFDNTQYIFIIFSYHYYYYLVLKYDQKEHK